MFVLLLALAHAADAPSFGSNPSCLVDGTWYPTVTDQPVATTFAGGVFSTRTVDGHRSAGYEVEGANVTFHGGSLGKPARGAASGCSGGPAGSYETTWAADCLTLRLVVVEDTCSLRKAQLDGVTWQRNLK